MDFPSSQDFRRELADHIWRSRRQEIVNIHEIARLGGPTVDITSALPLLS